MYKHIRHPASALTLTVAVIAATPAYAGQFLNYGGMGAPDSVAFETFPSVTHSGGKDSLYSNNILAYFTKTGFTGTTRDQFEAWVGGTAGYSEADSSGRGKSWGLSGPNIGLEYYYNVIDPKKCTGCEYSIYTISPLLIVTFPNGSADTTGFRAGSNNYSTYLGVNNFFKFGRWTTTINPVAINYSAESKNATDLGGGASDHLRGGVSYTVADMVVGYDVTPDLGLGVHHEYRFNNQSASSFEASRQGFIGPSVSYFGFSKQGLYLFGNFSFNYYHTNNLDAAPFASFVLVKYL